MKAIHPFPARMAPELVHTHLPGGESGLRVLDPMMGSGTTLVTARSRGYEAYGIDRDPLAVIIASAWTSDLNIDAFRSDARILLARAKIIARTLPKSESYPPNCDESTRKFIRYWFDERARRQLSALVRAVRETNFSTRLHLIVALSRMIITKQRGVSLAWDVSHSRPHRVCDSAPVSPFEFFLPNVEAIATRAPFQANAPRPNVVAAQGDCRDLSRFGDAFFDYVITSPPYLNAIDYLRGHKLTLVWLEHSISELARIRATNVGAEVGLKDNQWDPIVEHMVHRPEDLPPRFLNLCRRYACDLDKTIAEIARVSRSGAKVVLILGDSTIRGHEIRNSNAVTCLMQKYGIESLNEVRRTLQTKHRYLPPPSSMKQGANLQKRMAEEVVIFGRAP
jgi:DNA modification methylase